MMSLRCLYWIPLMMVSLLAAGCGGRAGSEEESTISKETALAPREVRVAAVTRYDFERGFRATGSLMPKEQARIRALLEGPLDAVFVEIGQDVKAGQPLFRIRQTDASLSVGTAEAALKSAKAGMEELKAWKRREEVEMLRADLKQCEAEADRLEADYRRNQSLYENKIIPKALYDAAKVAAESARARCQKTRAALEIAENGPTQEQIQTVKAQVAQIESAAGQAHQMLKDTTVVAPYSGEITATILKTGDYAKRADEVVAIADLSTLRAEMHLPERLASEITNGLKVDLEIQSTRLKREGQVVAVSDAVDLMTRTFLVKVEVANADRAIKGGAFCVGTFRLPTLRNQLAVPVAALQSQEGRSFVWVATGENKARRAFVRTGEQDKAFVEIREGLAGNEKVIVAGQGALADGDSLNVVDSATTAAITSKAK